MTLNINLLSRHALYQSSDFRLTRNGVLVTDTAPKQFRFDGIDWQAHITYTGLSELGGVRTLKWLTDLLVTVYTQDADYFDAYLDAIRTSATAEFRGHPRQRHTFSIVRFLRRRPELVLVSNFEDIGDHRRQLRQDFVISRRVVFSECLFITGQRQSVNDNDRRLLLHLARQRSPDAQAGMSVVAAVNGRAAAHASSLDTVSEGCLVSCLLSDGSYSTRAFGDTGPGSFAPPTVFQGVDVTEMLMNALAEDQSSIVSVVDVDQLDVDGWHVRSGMRVSRSSPSATLLADDRVLVVGGRGNRHDLNSAEIYDAGVDRWSDSGPLFHPRRSHTATKLLDGRVLIVGGLDRSTLCEIYDPLTGLWGEAGHLHTPRWCHTAMLLADGCVVVAGGTHDQALSECEVFEPMSLTWRQTGPLLQARYNHVAGVTADGR